MIAALIALLAGAALPFAFAPFNLYGIAFISPALLLLIWLRSTPWQATYRGFLFGLGLFGVGTSWVYISIHYFGHASIPLSTLLTGLLIAAMSLYFAAQGYVFRRLFQNKSILIQCVCVFPATWVVFEGLRAWLFTGFPWLSLGYSQITTPLKGFAPLIGIYGTSLAVCFIAGALALLAWPTQRIRIKIIAFLITGLFMLAGYSLQKINWTQPAGNPLSVGLVQGNIPQQIKWEPSQLISIMTIYKNLTENLFSKNQLIIWPEAAIPTLPQNVRTYYTLMDQLAKETHTYLIIGSPIYHAKTKRFYNGLQMIGQGKGTYLKQHLVPFGEYTPLKTVLGSLMKMLNIPMSDFSRGPQNQKPLAIGNYHAAAFICYEIAFSRDVLRDAKHTQFLINISDDSWFGHSIALNQQAEMAQFRALETGRPMLLGTNTGITGFINPQGQITQRLPIDQRATLSKHITPMKGETPLMRWNDYPLFALLLLLFLVGFVAYKKPPKKYSADTNR